MHAAVASESGTMFAAVGCYDGESWTSSVVSESDVTADDNVTSTLLEQPVAFHDLWRSPSGRLYLCDDAGGVHASTSATGATWTTARVAKRPLNVVWGFDDTNVYAAGLEGIVYRSNGKAWSKLGAPLGQPIAALGGSAPNDFYACGNSGLLAHFNGKSWTKIDIATKQDLMALVARSPKDVVVGGRRGALFEGARTKWKSLPRCNFDIFAMAQFDGALYAGGGERGIFTLSDNGSKNAKGVFAVYTLFATSKHLVASGGSAAVRFDGNEWSGPTYS